MKIMEMIKIMKMIKNKMNIKKIDFVLANKKIDKYVTYKIDNKQYIEKIDFYDWDKSGKLFLDIKQKNGRIKRLYIDDELIESKLINSKKSMIYLDELEHIYSI